NVVERALVLCEDSEITPEHLPLDKLRLPHVAPAATVAAVPSKANGGGAPSSAAAPLTPSEAAEKRRILELLAEHGGNQTRVAKKLGVARGTLIERLKRYGIKRPQSDD
ncbi:MAG TPA: helix-turn-helix domain-containing protein, partial [Polyangia bacterium]|nr:helix-turn-helix domain-containing protein [Polyangia bacterium]